MWFRWNRYGWGPWGPGFRAMYGPYDIDFYNNPYAYGTGAPYYGSPWEGSYDPRQMELMALRDELEFMSYRVSEILKRIDELEKEMK